LLIPYVGAQRDMARRVAAAGAAVALMPGEDTTDAVAEACGRLLKDDSYRGGCDRIAAEFAALPPLAAAVAPLRRLAGSHAQDAPAVQLTQQCNGAIAAMDLAASYLTAGPSRTGVVIATGENWNTGLVDRWSSASSCIFGDSGTALVLSRRAGFARLRSTVLL